MSCNCKSSPCTCSKTSSCQIIISDDVKYTGTNFTCEDDNTISITSGQKLSAILLLIFQKLCSLFTSVNNISTTVNNIVEAHIIEDEGVALPQQDTLNFVGDGVSVANVGSKTVVTIDSIVGGVGADGKSFRYGVGVPGAGLGNDGDTYVDLASPNLDIYTKSGGVWTDTTLDMKGATGAAGSNGTNGTNGTNGINGLNFIQGAGVPLSGLGNDGDTYFDNLTGDIYLKVLGSWNLINNIYKPVIASQYGFMAQRTLAEEVLSNLGENSMIFDDDSSAGFYDYGNDYYTDQYIVPIGGINQKFIVENVYVRTTAGSTFSNYTLRIKVNGLTVTSQTSPNLTVDTTPIAAFYSLATPYQTLNAGDIVTVTIQPSNTNTYIQPGCKFSNSFEL